MKQKSRRKKQLTILLVSKPVPYVEEHVADQTIFRDIGSTTSNQIISHIATNTNQILTHITKQK